MKTKQRQFLFLLFVLCLGMIVGFIFLSPDNDIVQISRYYFFEKDSLSFSAVNGQTISNPYPANASEEIELQPMCSIDVELNASWELPFTLLESKDDVVSYYDVYNDGTYIYAACYSGGICAYSFDGSDFTLLDIQDDGGYYYNVYGDGTYIYASCVNDGIRAYSFDGSDFTLLDTQDDGGSYRGIFSNESYIYVACYGDGIRAYSFDGSDFTLLDTQDDDGGYLGVFGDGTYVYATCDGDGIRAYSFNGSNFTLLDTQDEGGSYNGVFGDGTYIYAASYDGGVCAYSFNGSNFTLLDAYNDGSVYYNDVWSDGIYVYTACNDDIRAYSFNGSNFTLSGIQDDGGTYGDVFGDGTYVYTTCYGDGIRAYRFNESEEASLTISFYDNTSSEWIFRQQNVTDVNGTIQWTYENAINLGTVYFWKIVTTNNKNISETVIYHFMTENPNSLPNITEVYPLNGSLGTTRYPRCYIVVNDTDLDILSVSFYYNNSDGVWVLDYNETNVTSGSTVYWNFTEADEYKTLYQWKVIVNDSTDEAIGNYSFTTREDTSDTKNYSRPPDNSGDSSTPSSTPKTPGFETIFFLTAISVFFLARRKRKD